MIQRLIIIGLFCLLAISAHAEEADIDQVLNELQMKQIDIEQLDQIASEELDSRGSAPPLTFLQILAVASQNHPNWNDSVWQPNRYVTAEDHGGDWMLVVTYERGTDQPGSQNLMGIPLPFTILSMIPMQEGLWLGFINIG